jgi:4-amino-4-deoxy-L-arabinose transferase-like glycosyltransferase
MFQLQTLIHRLEVGGGSGYLRGALAALALVVVLGAYDLRCYKNFSAQEAMDAAQLARNIAQGKGYTTSSVRPFSLYLLKRKAQKAQPNVSLDFVTGTGQVERHPDLANPPVYPLVLAGLMKILPFRFTIPEHPSGFWTINGQWARHQPDFLIALFNQALFLGVVALAFLLARHLFDASVAWISAALLLGTELFWRFSISGLSTMLLLLIFMSLAWCLVLLEREAREPRWGRAGLPLLAALTGLLVGLGGLTRYSFAWLIIPAVIWVVAVSGHQRVVTGLLTLGLFAASLTPWVLRNYSVCGEPFGTASYARVEATYLFPGHSLERSLKPELGHSALAGLRTKMFANLKDIVTNELPRLGGNWVSGFFLVGLLLGFQRPGVRRLRYFLVASLALFVVVQSLGRTQLSEDSPEINSENLLALAAPLVLVYGVSLFLTLLEQVNLALLQLRNTVIVLFGAVTCLPLLLQLLGPRGSPLAFPPYYPPVIQRVCDWTEPHELVMSDIPWAVAWYGQAQSVWLTLDSQTDFFAINDYEKPVRALYLTQVTLDNRFLSQWVKSKHKSWEKFVLDWLFRRAEKQAGPPQGFPLTYWQQGGFWPDQFLLTFREKPLKAP